MIAILTLIIGLLAGLIIGLVGGYLIGKARNNVVAAIRVADTVVTTVRKYSDDLGW